MPRLTLRGWSRRAWDMRPYAPQNRCVKLFTGHSHNFEKALIKCDWSADGKSVACGSADWAVYVWDFATRNIRYKLPGHKVRARVWELWLGR